MCFFFLAVLQVGIMLLRLDAHAHAHAHVHSAHPPPDTASCLRRLGRASVGLACACLLQRLVLPYMWLLDAWFYLEKETQAWPMMKLWSALSWAEVPSSWLLAFKRMQGAVWSMPESLEKQADLPIYRDYMQMFEKLYCNFGSMVVIRSYHQENRRSHQNSQLKPGWAGLVLG